MKRNQLAVFMLLALGAGAGAANEQVMLVLDASGSMWGEIEDRSKIDILRAGLVDQLSSYENRVDLGLLAFGHRRKSDCRDVEVLQPVGPLDAATIADRLGGINPRGRTPIAVALETGDRAIQDEWTEGPEAPDADAAGIGWPLDPTPHHRRHLGQRRHIITDHDARRSEPLSPCRLIGQTRRPGSPAVD